MALTVKDFILGVLEKKYQAEFSNIVDPIEMLSEGRIEYIPTKNTKVLRTIKERPGTGAVVDKYNKVSGDTNISNFRDYTYTGDDYEFPLPYDEGFQISNFDLSAFGLDADMLLQPKNLIDGAIKDGTIDIEGVTQMLYEYMVDYIDAIKERRKQQVRDLCINLGTVSAPASQKAFGLNMVDTAASRTTRWSATNKGDAALDETEYDIAVDFLAGGQKNILNQDYGQSAPMLLLHASSYTKAQKIMLPGESVDANRLAPGKTIDPTLKQMVGVYNDPTNRNDWILFGKNHQVYRLAKPSPSNQLTGGLYIYIDISGGNITFHVCDNSIMVCDSPIDIYKAIVA